jgi:hypothetical protein
MGLILFQGLICPSDSPELLNASSTVASSPFTIGFVKAGWNSAGDFINVFIVVAFISAVNGCIYVQSRALYSLALTHRAPQVFAITSKKGGTNLICTTLANLARPLTIHSSVRVYSDFCLLGLPCPHELESHGGPSFCIHDFRGRFSSIHCLGRHHRHPPPSKKWICKTRYRPIHISVQSIRQYLDIQIQLVPRHIFAANSRLHCFREAFQLAAFRGIVHYDPYVHFVVYWVQVISQDSLVSAEIRPRGN